MINFCVVHPKKLVIEIYCINCVYSKSYRLAPEHVFPAALDDCLAATKHLFENSDVYGVDSTRIALMGKLK